MADMHDRVTILPLILDRVSYRVGATRTIEDISCEFGGGTHSVILSANGAGKSVLLRLFHGLLRPTGGAVRWRGAFPGDPARRQAMVFQRPVMLRRSALGNVAYGLKLAGVTRSERNARAREALDRVGLADRADRPARVLSGGEQQRVALARAWALTPEILFLDEPTASLDPAATRAVEDIITAIHRAGAKIIMTTHNLGQARRVADDVLFLDRGRLVDRAPTARFFTAPAAPEAAAFIAGESP